MAVDQSGLKWPQVPIQGAVGAGRQDALPDAPAGFGLTPSGQAEQDAAQPAETPEEEVPGGGPE